MKHLLIMAGMLLLVGILAGGTCFADVLYSEDFSGRSWGYGGKLVNYGAGPHLVAEEGMFFLPIDGELDGGNGDEAEEEFIALTGDLSWSDVAIQAKMRINGHDTGVAEFIVRAKDNKNYYAFRYTTGQSRVMPDEEASGIKPPMGSPNLRIIKVVNGKWKILAESNDPSIPDISAVGDRAGEQITFRFEVKGDKLVGYIDDGKGMKKWLEATDSDLQTGMVGLGQYDYYPVWDDLLVESL
ncbi:MAG: hypothetical protein ACTSV7_10730 [Candidatus Baldrarchaeia archaeon]